MEEMNKLFKQILEQIHEIVEKDLIKKKKIYKMSEIDEVLGKKTMTEFYRIINDKEFYGGDGYFYVKESGRVISITMEELEEMANETLDKMEYAEQLKLIKRVIESLENEK